MKAVNPSFYLLFPLFFANLQHGPLDGLVGKAVRTEGSGKIGVRVNNIKLAVPLHIPGIGTAGTGMEVKRRFPDFTCTIDAEHDVGDLRLAIGAAAGAASQAPRY